MSVMTLSGTLGGSLGLLQDGPKNNGTLGIISSMYHLVTLFFLPLLFLLVPSPLLVFFDEQKSSESERRRCDGD